MEKKNDVKDLKEEKDVKDEKKEHNSADAKIEALIEMGKSKGVLTYKEVMDTLDDLELDSEQIERIYDRFEALNIDVVEEMEIPPTSPAIYPSWSLTWQHRGRGS